MTDAPSDDRLLMGEIGAAQGLKGEVRLRSYTQDPAAIAEYGPLEDGAGVPRIEIESVRVTPKALVARIKGVTTREGAEALNGTKLYLARALLPENAEDEWYQADMIGLAVLDREGEVLGRLVAVHNFGASDLLEIQRADGAPNVLVPFTQSTVPEVDIEGGKLVLVPPEGLFEDVGRPGDDEGGEG
ncbi:MAG: ribosome maturation factor RimM [Methyloceanibacter sp.]|uniref:ribosome maturation factor RimM n=1 Tax=Methyloceanibacter sp. TaxID=1965321 RepID=UPI003D9BAF99